jgi:hypothetical protein
MLEGMRVVNVVFHAWEVLGSKSMSNIFKFNKFLSNFYKKIVSKSKIQNKIIIR